MKLAFVLGTRPEAIKLSSLIRTASVTEGISPIVISTGQHRQMLDQMLDWFNIKPDFDLNVMKFDQSLADLTSLCLSSLLPVIRKMKPDWVVVQGDTASAFSGALAAFYEKIPVVHVEAGLRTDDPLNPYPEEMFRRLISQIAELHCAATTEAAITLAREGHSSEKILITGNTGIDALLWTKSRISIDSDATTSKVLITCHRREDQASRLQNLCKAIRILSTQFPKVTFKFPMHLSPTVRRIVIPQLADLDQVELLEPLNYPEFVAAMAEASLILTDSGGIQEEAPSLGVPVLVTRTTTERPEAVEAGCTRLIGFGTEAIVSESARILENLKQHHARSPKNIYGDGSASSMIISHLHSRSAYRKEAMLVA